MVKKPEQVDNNYKNIKSHFSTVKEKNQTSLNRLTADQVQDKGKQDKKAQELVKKKK